MDDGHFEKTLQEVKAKKEKKGSQRSCKKKIDRRLAGKLPTTWQGETDSKTA